MKKSKLILISIFASFILTACSNIAGGSFEEKDSSKSAASGSVSGVLKFGGAFPGEYADALKNLSSESSSELNDDARAAFPNSPDISNTLTSKTIRAINQDDESDVVTGGSYNALVHAFIINGLRLGVRYKVEAVVSLADGGIKILSGLSEEFTLSAANAVKPNIDIELHPVVTADGTGNVSLSATISNSAIKKVRTTIESNVERWKSKGETDVSYVHASASSVVLQKNGVPSGSYMLKIEFLTDNLSASPLYVTRQVLNVFDGLTTLTWSGEDECLTSDGKLQVTAALCTKFNTVTDFYVGGTGKSNSNPGTWAKPLETIDAALNKMNDPTKIYTINISENITASTTLDMTSIDAASVTIRGDGENISLSAGGSGTTLTINTPSSCPIILENIKITGGNNSNGYGGGIAVNSGSVTLGNGAVVADNKAKYGGGVYVKSGASLFMYGSAIIGDRGTDDNYSNHVTREGGGIYNEGNLYLGYTGLNGSTPIVATGEKKFTGGVCHNSTVLTSRNASGLGGGICNNGVLYVAGGNISHNYINRTSISGAMHGAGIYVANGARAVLTGSVVIEGNVSEASGGGIYVNGTSSPYGSVTLKNDENGDAPKFLDNKAESSGGGAITNWGNLEISGKVYIPYGGDSGQNDIYLPGNAGNTAKITIVGEFSTPSGYVSGPYAVIRPQTYSPKNIVLSGDTDILKDIAETEKIKIVDQGSGIDAIEWIISKSGNGKMQLKNPLMKMYVKSDGNDSNLGNSVNNAFATLNQCWNVITEQEVVDGEYEIYISGTITGKQIIPKTTTGTNALNVKKDTTAKSILISGNSPLNGGSPQDTINANVGDTAASGGSAITINTDVPVTFKKINITGGNTTGNGGGLNISSSSNVIVDSYVWITENNAKAGGGIYNAGTLTVKGGEITKNNTGNNNDGCYGGGIYNNGGTVFIYGTPLIGASGRGNYGYTGGGICNNGYLYIGYSSAKSDKTPDKIEYGAPLILYNTGLEGTGIFNKANCHIYMRDGNISYNEASGFGAGIYTSGTVTMSGGSITNNKNTSSVNNHGGGVYISSSGTFNMEGGSISENDKDVTFNVLGSAIYNAGTLNMKGSISIPAGSDGNHNIYLLDDDSRAINITGTITGTAPVAKIKSTSTTEGRILLKKDTDVTGQNFATSVSKFTLVNSGYSIVTNDAQTQATLFNGVRVSSTDDFEAAISNLTENGAKIVLTGSSTIDTSCLASASYKIKLDVTNYTGDLAAIQKPNIQEIIINSSQISSAYVFRNQAGTAVCSDLRTVHIKGTDTTTAYGMRQANLFQGCTSLRNIYFDEGVQKVCIGWGFMNNYIQNTVSIYIPSTATSILLYNATNSLGNASDFNKIYGLYYKGTKDALKNITVTAEYPKYNNNDQITAYYNDSSSFLIYWKKGENVATGSWVEE